MDAAERTRQRVCRALLDDLDAGYGEVVREYGGVVHSVARALTRSAADAEDLTAEAFLRAYRALAGYPAERIAVLALRPWLLTVLRNTARNAARDAARRPAGPPRYEPTERELDPGPTALDDPADHAERAEAGRGLAALLARLPEAQRTAVVLRHALDLPIAEVAQVLRVGEGTAKSHVSRGLHRLRALVTAAGTEPGPDGEPAHRVLASGRRDR
ncbi:RNA polymerase sigma factor [Pseudonocardia humida]|uniref:RNA polymerase sigma factor n=1 Tax=Pseudonocardia humida TaxID=2800819 RepID=A0ABT0ZTL2_9PSEU|nr:RNA polymerase sigma factor [Pseudonocardia humida]MCO1654066.1 RNA polymerase sigma factor [Pseudonocardia humida]